MDWDSRDSDVDDGFQFASQPDPAIGYRPGNYLTTRSDFEQCVGELIERLVRTERLSIYFNPVFGLFSAPGDPLEDFLAQVADAALGRIEPELKRLRNRFELQLEQVREAQASKGSLTESLNLESFISNKLHFFESENRLAGMFSTLAGAVFGSAEPRTKEELYRADEAELREDLERIEQEASEALRALYDNISHSQMNTIPSRSAFSRTIYRLSAASCYGCLLMIKTKRKGQKENGRVERAKGCSLLSAVGPVPFAPAL
jgi:hypothetical protein